MASIQSSSSSIRLAATVLLLARAPQALIEAQSSNTINKNTNTNTNNNNTNTNNTNTNTNNGKTTLSKTTHSNYAVLMIQRQSKMAFMPNMTVFAGGAYDAKADMEIIDVAQTSSWLRKPIDENDKKVRMTAIRETFEEVGLLLIDGGQQAPHNYAHTVMIGKSIEEQKKTQMAVHADSTLFGKLMEKHAFTPAVNKLLPFARWITPQQEGRRFDTYFYVAAIDKEVDPIAESSEVAKARWFTPEHALELARQKKIVMPPPTVHCLYQLSLIPDLDEVLARMMKRPIYPILPTLLSKGSTVISALPGDRLHRPREGAEAVYAAHNIPNNSFNRIVRQSDGSWKVFIGDNVDPKEADPEGEVKPLAKL